MKQSFTKFTCDKCKKKITVKEGIGFPYSKEWVFLYNFTFKITNKLRPAIIDCHFCSKKCLKEYLNFMVDRK